MKGHLKPSVILALIISLPLCCSMAQTYVSGTYSSSTVWTAEGSPYILTGDITIGRESASSDATLRIEENVVVEMGPYSIKTYYLKGHINAAGATFTGSSGSRISFAAGTTGIFLNSGFDSVYCYIAGGSPDFENCTFENNTVPFRWTTGGYLGSTNNTFEENSFVQVNGTFGKSATFSDCGLPYRLTSDIQVGRESEYSDATLRIEENVVVEMGTYSITATYLKGHLNIIGALLEGSNAQVLFETGTSGAMQGSTFRNVSIKNYSSNLSVQQCNILHDKTGMENFSTTPIDATDCWWGSSTGPYHPSLNPSGQGCEISDNIDFIPWSDHLIRIFTGPFPEVQCSSSVLQLALNETANLDFILRNLGDSADHVTLNVSVSENLDIIDDLPPDRWTRYEIGSLVMQKTDEESPSLVSSNLIYEVYEHLFGTEEKEYSLAIKRTAPGDAWVKYRAAMNPGGVPNHNYNPDTYKRYPQNGETDQQGWFAGSAEVGEEYDSVTHIVTVAGTDHAPVENARVILAYHNNLGAPGNLDFKPGFTDSYGTVSFDIPVHSDMTVFSYKDAFNPVAYTELDVIHPSEITLEAEPDNSDGIITLPGIIRELLVSTSPTYRVMAGMFDILPDLSASIVDFNKYLLEASQDEHYDLHLVSMDPANFGEVVPAAIVRVKTEEDLHIKLCNSLREGISFLLAIYGGAPGHIELPFCPASNEEMILEVNGIEHEVRTGPSILFGAIRVYYTDQPVSAAYRAACDMDFFFEDHLGRMTGSDYDNGEFVGDKYEIPGVYYSGHLSHPTTIVIDTTIAGNLILQPVETGDYHLSMWLNDGTTTYQSGQNSSATDLTQIPVPYPPFSTGSAPLARAGILFDSLPPNEWQVFDASASVDQFGGGLSYVWSEGDTVLSTEESFSMKFSRGWHYVALRATDQNLVSSFDACYFYSEGFSTSDPDLKLPATSGHRGVMIFPNPFTDGFTVATCNGHRIQSIEMVDILGRTHRIIDHIRSNSVMVSRESLPGGLYFLKVRADDTYFLKVIAR